MLLRGPGKTQPRRPLTATSPPTARGGAAGVRVTWIKQSCYYSSVLPDGVVLRVFITFQDLPVILSLEPLTYFPGLDAFMSLWVPGAARPAPQGPVCPNYIGSIWRLLIPVKDS